MNGEQQTEQRDAEQQTDHETDQETGQQEEAEYSYGDPKDGQEYLDRSKLDFDPKDGLYSGTAVDGTSEIPGPHLKDGDEERTPDEMRQQAEEQAKEGGVDPDDTPAAKSPVARAAEKGDAENGEGGAGDGEASSESDGDGDDNA